MAIQKIKTKGSAQLSKYKWVEWLTKSHPAVILIMYVPFCIYLLYYFHKNVQPDLLIMSMVFLAGVLSWTLTEYVMHRYVFHIEGSSPWVKRFNYIVHGVHHEYPKDRQRLIMPPLPSIILAAAFFYFWRLFTGSYVYAFFSGFMIGYLTYVMIHYSTHAFRPPRNGFRFLWVYHGIHHYSHPDKAFGVSSAFWDHVFGTYPPKEVVQKKMGIKAKEFIDDGQTMPAPH